MCAFCQASSQPIGGAIEYYPDCDPFLLHPLLCRWSEVIGLIAGPRLFDQLIDEDDEHVLTETRPRTTVETVTVLTVTLQSTQAR